MRILVSNDDGYRAEGLQRLVDALLPLAQVTVVAPERNRSGASNSLTLDVPLRLRNAPTSLMKGLGYGKGLGSGPGGPVLKLVVHHWLRKVENVAAFATARPADGGSGAVHVLLASRR